ncbi:hypothetical protein CROQUDRAFT_650067 [Cronartium quercuum f. sp. fusiforme G11]|uniref:Uncharacterized protein n=1 Tax=Cronartium quercuum f. sp. fusiforme G11 TaxID=708437 RepID=A0A9P6TH94_9BASI|nr:hypothetical protein CROQUDRAFT_650067 [Cronartium quercuum f. sp. fusiforme G11]
MQCNGSIFQGRDLEKWSIASHEDMLCYIASFHAIKIYWQCLRQPQYSSQWLTRWAQDGPMVDHPAIIRSTTLNWPMVNLRSMEGFDNSRLAQNSPESDYLSH